MVIHASAEFYQQKSTVAVLFRRPGPFWRRHSRATYIFFDAREVGTIYWNEPSGLWWADFTRSRDPVQHGTHYETGPWASLDEARKWIAANAALIEAEL